MIKHINFSTGDYHRKLQTSVLLLLLSCFAFVFVPYIVSSANAATSEVSTDVTWVPISLTLSSGGDIAFGSVIPSTASGSNYGTMKVIRKNVSVTTNGKAADVYLSMVDSSTALTYGSNATSIEIPAIKKSENALAEFDDTATFSGVAWGYAVPVISNGSISNVNGDFGAATAYNAKFGNDGSSSQVYDQLSYGDSAYNFGEWAAVPAKNNAEKIWSVTTTNVNGLGGTGDTTKNNFNIYYAVMADSNLVSGSYGNEVVYTALASTASLDEASTNIRVSNTSSNGVSSATQRFVTEGDVLNLAFDLAQTQSTLINKNDTVVYLVPHSEVGITGSGSSAVYSVSSTMENNKANYPVCTIDTMTVSSDSANGAEINCTIEAKNNSGSSVSIPRVSTTTGGELNPGYYDVWIRNEKYGIDYISRYWTGSSNIATLGFVGLQSISSNSNKYIIENMQDMTSSVCFNTNEFGTQYGANSTVYNYTGTGTALATGTNATLPKSTPSNSAGTFSLKDTRDNKQYLVRRLADGNCWMVQNLDLDLAMAGKSGGFTMTKENTDITADTYTPTAYSSGTGVGSLNERIGSPSGCQQFIPYGGNTVNGSACFWGSKIGEDGSTLSEVTNNARAEIPRQYENGNDWIDNSNPNTDGAGSLYRSSGTPSNTATDAANTQYMGNWYNWYAATAESGTYAMDSGNASDSICPKGWQLPEYSGSRSWYNLLTGTYYSVNKTAVDKISKDVCEAAGYTVNASGRCVNGSGQNQTSVTEWANSISSVGGSRMLRNVPLSIIFSGNYAWVYGGRDNRGTHGYYYSSTPYVYTNSHSLGFHSAYVNPQSSGGKTSGMAVRCVAR